MTSPPGFSAAARLFAKLSVGIGANQQQQSIEHKMAELRAVYATQPTATAQSTKSSLSTQYKPAPRRPGRTSLPTPSLGDMLEHTFSSRSCVPSRRASTVNASCYYSSAPSIMDLASSAGLLSLAPSDLVFESSVLGIAYYDFVLSVSEVSQCDDPPPPATVAARPVASARNSVAATTVSVVAATTLEPPPATTPSLSAAAACNDTIGGGCRTRMLSPATKRRVHGTGSDPTTQQQQQPLLSPANGVVAALAAQAAEAAATKTRKSETRKSGGGSAVGGVLAKLTESSGKKQQRPQSAAATPVERKVSLVTENMAEICETTTGSKSPAHSLTVYRLLLAKFDPKTNVEWFESVLVPAELLERNGIPVSELSLLTMGILVWRCTLNNARLLCLVNGMQREHMHEDGNATAVSFEALKRAACKYKCMHHVLTIGQRRPSAGSTHSSGGSSSSRRSSASSGSYMQHHHQQDSGMKLRVLMCQSRNELPEFPAYALRDAKFLLAPNTNPLFCLCFPLT